VARGPGVVREFFQKVMEGFLQDDRFFEFKPQLRTYWPPPDADVEFSRQGYRAIGVLMGKALGVEQVLFPACFPTLLYDRLLHFLGSPLAKPELGLEDLSQIEDAVANGLREVLEYADDDIGEKYEDLGWERAGLDSCELSQATKERFVSTIVRWMLVDRCQVALEELGKGFELSVGQSQMLRTLVDARQLEQIVCGDTTAVDIEALRSNASYQGWDDEDDEYLDWFWSVLGELDDEKKTKFVVFVTASDRAPLGGWRDCRLIVQRSGREERRDCLPASFTCMSMLMLPRYETRAKLRSKLLQAIESSEGFGLQ